MRRSVSRHNSNSALPLRVANGELKRSSVDLKILPVRVTLNFELSARIWGYQLPVLLSRSFLGLETETETWTK